MTRHTLKLRILVRTANMWEKLKSYIWRNLGHELWTKKNVTELQLTRIHVKSNIPKYIENRISGWQTALNASAHLTNGRGCVDFWGGKEGRKKTSAALCI